MGTGRKREKLISSVRGMEAPPGSDVGTTDLTNCGIAVVSESRIEASIESFTEIDAAASVSRQSFRQCSRSAFARFEYRVSSRPASISASIFGPDSGRGTLTTCVALSPCTTTPDCCKVTRRVVIFQPSVPPFIGVPSISSTPPPAATTRILRLQKGSLVAS